MFSTDVIPVGVARMPASGATTTTSSAGAARPVEGGVLSPSWFNGFEGRLVLGIQSTSHAVSPWTVF